MKHSIQSACPVCGASLPHTTPMAREYHENVLRRSEQVESLPTNHLVTIPLAPGDDEVLTKVVASFLARQGVADVSALPCAVQLLVTLERYRTGKDMQRCASALGVSADTVEAYKK